MFSDLFSNPLDQREKNQSWLVISALFLLTASRELEEGAAPCQCRTE